MAVGCAAAVLHWLTAVAAVRAGLAPLVANPLGWFVAFWMSWAGHQWLSFRAASPSPWRSLPRFAAVSFAGFAVNEAAYAWMLHESGLRFDIALALVLVVVAVLTWAASRRWAFTGTTPPAAIARDRDATGQPHG